MRVPWTIGDAPPIPRDGWTDDELATISIHLRHYPETRNIQLLEHKAKQSGLVIGSVERFLQALSVYLLKYKTVSQRISSTPKPLSLTSRAFEPLLAGLIVCHNQGIHSRDRSKTRHQVWEFGLGVSSKSDQSFNRRC